MATNTPNYNLVKPSGTEFADIDVLNGNSDIIDAQMKTNADNISAATTELNNKFDKTGGILTGDVNVQKNLPRYRLQTTNNTKSWEVRLNANDINDFGCDMYRNGEIYERVVSDKNVQFRDTDGSYFSIQSLKQNFSDRFSDFAAAITAKGVPTASDANATTITNNINAIPTSTPKATGTVTSSTSTAGFNYANGSNTNSYYVTVTGLTFLAKKITIFTDGDATFTSYTIYQDGFFFGNIISSSANNQSYTATSKSYQLGQNAFINGTEFRLPVDVPNRLYNWIAEA